MHRAALSVGCALLLLSSGLSAATLSRRPAPIHGVYSGEAVVHALGGAGLMIALDEAGHGVATQTFLVTTDRPLPSGLDLRSTSARIEHRADGLYVALPREHRVLVFSIPGLASQAERPDLAWTGLDVTEIGGVTGLAEYRGSSRVLLPLDDVEAGRVPPVLRAMIAARDKVPQNQPGPTSGDGSGCQTSCSVNCGNGSNCTLTCTGGRCGSCTCVTNFGASCSCS
jgi:hypothetical protein